jgi:hypothetical protein
VISRATRCTPVVGCDANRPLIAKSIVNARSPQTGWRGPTPHGPAASSPSLPLRLASQGFPASTSRAARSARRGDRRRARLNPLSPTTKTIGVDFLASGAPTSVFGEPPSFDATGDGAEAPATADRPLTLRSCNDVAPYPGQLLIATRAASSAATRWPPLTARRNLRATQATAPLPWAPRRNVAGQTNAGCLQHRICRQFHSGAMKA